MALAIWPARQGQQRSLRRIPQLLSWALARSPGARSFAWAELAAFWEAGLFRPGRGVDVLTCADVALVGQHDQPGVRQFAHHGPDPGGGQVMDSAAASAAPSFGRQGLPARVQLAPARPDLAPVAADHPGHTGQGLGRQRQRGTVGQHRTSGQVMRTWRSRHLPGLHHEASRRADRDQPVPRQQDQD